TERQQEGNLRAVGRVVLVLSGKGGVGKSTITTELALALQHAGKKCEPDVNVFECSIYYKGCPQTFGRLVFVVAHSDLSLGFHISALIGQFVRDVAWGELDVLLVDTPPGTSDEHLAVLENLRKHRVDGAVLVTTPQAVSIGDVRREITFCKKTGVKILGIVENMSGFVCPHCSHLTIRYYHDTLPDFLSLSLSLSLSVGSVPLDPLLAESIEEGRDFLQAFPESATYSSLRAIAESVLTRLQD
uniref:Nucleotide binding protein 2 (MinD homolog, E. coli) n=1 Tax=Astyanax mexicanus TaxID=7994 RepID=A0A3B1ITU0_ASTMX